MNATTERNAMPGQMTIFEGMDGTGKTTAINHFHKRHKNVKLRPRAVKSSLEGPVDDLSGWIDREIAASERDSTLDHWVYDRHPIISEAVYGPVLRGDADRRVVSPENVLWLSMMTTVVFCVPPRSFVLKNLIREGADEQMPGVLEHWMEIYNQYWAFAQSYTGKKLLIDTRELQA